MSEQTMTQTQEIPVTEMIAGDSLLTLDGTYALVNGVLEEDGKITAAVTTADNENLSWQWDAGNLVTIIARETTEDTADKEVPPPAPASLKVPAVKWEDGKNLSRCAYKTEKGRQCKLVDNHEGDHVFMFRGAVSTPKTLAELRKADAKTFGKFTLAAEDIPATADLSRQYNREVERDDDQKRVDVDAKAAYDKWTKGGKKSGEFEAIAPKFGKRYIVPAPAFDTVIMMLRRAVQSGSPVAGKKLAYRRAQHESGNVIINFTITDDGAIKRAKSDGANGNGA
jgi:hypothetical protein